MKYVCFRCRHVQVNVAEARCPKGHPMFYTFIPLPKCRDDHKSWQLAERVFEDQQKRSSRR